MSRPLAESWNWIATQWERGATVHANLEGVLKAEAEPRFVGGDACLNRCGTIVRHLETELAVEALWRHASNPRACRQHPEWKGGF